MLPLSLFEWLSSGATLLPSLLPLLIPPLFLVLVSLVLLLSQWSSGVGAVWVLSTYDIQGSMFQEVCIWILLHSCSSFVMVHSSPLTTCHHFATFLPLPSLYFLLTRMLAPWTLVSWVMTPLTVVDEQSFSVPQTLRFPGRGFSWCWPPLLPRIGTLCFWDSRCSPPPLYCSHSSVCHSSLLLPPLCLLLPSPPSPDLWLCFS